MKRSNVATMSRQKTIIVVLKFLVFLLQFNGLLCLPSSWPTEETSKRETTSPQTTDPSAFDKHVLDRVKTQFTRRTLFHHSTPTPTKKSLIQTLGKVAKSPLHVKIDPEKFGQTLLDQANQNAARKSDIYMDKAIDATALGVAVLKLIFGKDAKMLMKEDRTRARKADKDSQPSLRTTAFRPQITSWARPKSAMGERKSMLGHSLRKSDKISRLGGNILNLVKSLHYSSSFRPKGDTKAASARHITQSPKHQFAGYTSNEANLVHLLHLMKETHEKAQKGAKKSWVLLKVPTKQPQDELGMLSDPSKTEENSNDRSEIHDKQHESGKYNTEKHSQVIVHQRLHSSIRSHRKALKSEPVREMNAVKTEVTPKSGSSEASVRNLLHALESSSGGHETAVKETASYVEPRTSHRRKIELVPRKSVEENAAAKDELGGSAGPGAVVSLDALRQLGKMLGLAGQNNRISPYTGTADTLTPATPTLPSLQDAVSNPSPTPPPTNSTPAPTQSATESKEASLDRISEQLKMFAERGLRSHNEYRKLHHASPLKWSEDLASAAEKLAYQAAKQDKTTRSKLVQKKGYGENIVKISNIVLENAGEEATRHWYNEKEQFTFSDPTITDGTQAFTQLIWKDTKLLGMGAAKDDDTGELYVVALYHPKGNKQETLRENLQSDGKTNADVYASIFKKGMIIHR